MTTTELLFSLLMATSPAAEAPSASTDTTGTDTKVILEAIQREREVLARERAELEAARQDIQRAETAIDAKLTKLEKAIEERQAVEKAILAAKQVLFSARLARLVEITSKMSAERSAAYLLSLPEGTAVSILEGLQPRKAALVLSQLPPSKAAKLSRIYLKREHNADTRRNADGNEERVAAPE